MTIWLRTAGEQIPTSPKLEFRGIKKRKENSIGLLVVVQIRNSSLAPAHLIAMVRFSLSKNKCTPRGTVWRYNPVCRKTQGENHERKPVDCGRLRHDHGAFSTARIIWQRHSPHPWAHLHGKPQGTVGAGSGHYLHAH